MSKKRKKPIEQRLKEFRKIGQEQRKMMQLQPMAIDAFEFKKGRIVRKVEPKEEGKEEQTEEKAVSVQSKIDTTGVATDDVNIVIDYVAKSLIFKYSKMLETRFDVMTEIADRFRKKLNDIQNKRGEVNPEEENELQELQKMAAFMTRNYGNNITLQEWLQLKNLRSSLNLVQNNVNNFEVNISKIITKLGIDDRLKIIDEIMKDDDTD